MVIVRLLRIQTDENVLSQIYLSLFEARLLAADFAMGLVLPTVRSLVVRAETTGDSDKLKIDFIENGSISFLFSAGHFIEMEEQTTRKPCDEL